MPDEFQARILLPTGIAERFYRFEIDCYQAGLEWLELSKQDPGVHWRVNELISLGASLDSDGQVKTLTGVWEQVEDRTIFKLETDERRFWGSVLNVLLNGDPYRQEPLLEAISVPEPNRVRQVIENEKYEPPTAVARARSVAALINYFYEIQPGPLHFSRHEFHRKALGIRVSGKVWQELERIFGVQRPLLVRHLQLLDFPDHLLDLADQYALPERQLREVRALPEDQWEQAINDLVRWTSSGQAQPAPEQAPARPPRQRSDPFTKAARRIRGILHLINKRRGESVGALADSLYAEFESKEQILEAADQLENLAEQLRVRVHGQE